MRPKRQAIRAFQPQHCTMLLLLALRILGACIATASVASASDVRALTTSAPQSASLLEEDANESICVSNRGRPYDESDCNLLGPKRGCVWKDDECVCQNGGHYSKSSRKCWPPGEWPLDIPLPSTSETPETSSRQETLNESVCVSNHGRPYDESDCKLLGPKKGCIWKDNQCVCQNGGHYAKSSRKCWAPGEATLDILPLTTSAPQSTSLLGEDANESICVSNRGRPYDESDCNLLGPKRGCVWKDDECVCQNGGHYSKSSRKCWPPGEWPLDTPLPSTSETPETSSRQETLNESVCVSNHGRPYDESDCKLLGPKKGCIWKDNQCVCQNGGHYAKSSRKCWAPGEATLDILPLTTSAPQSTSLLGEDANESICVSNRGRPYDESDCNLLGPKRGCVWKDDECVCQNGGHYSKSSRKCWPPGEWPLDIPLPSTSETPETSSRQETSNGSVCVSNHGLPYDHPNCELLGPKRGCVWKDGKRLGVIYGLSFISPRIIWGLS